MRMLCCLDGTNAERIRQGIARFLSKDDQTLALLYVTDSGPEAQMEQRRGRYLRSPFPPPFRREQMHEAEQQAAQEILEEGRRLLGHAETLHRTGRPEREIVRLAQEWQAGLLVVCSRSLQGSGPSVGPASVGHVARFVLDHAPCSVLLLRPQMEQSGESG